MLTIKRRIIFKEKNVGFVDINWLQSWTSTYVTQLLHLYNGNNYFLLITSDMN